MKTGKRIIMFVLVSALLLFAAACGSAGGANKEEAVKTAVTEYLSKLDDVAEVNVTEVKIFSEKDFDEALIAELNLGKDDIMYAVKYDLKAAEGTDPNMLAIPDGEVDGEWSRNMSRVGVLRYADGKYSVDPNNFGTGF